MTGLTSQQKEMLNKLPELVNTYSNTIANVPAIGNSIGQKFFEYIMTQKHPDPNGKGRQKFFEESTCMSRKTYNNLLNSKVDIGVLTITQVCIGLGVTYEDAVIMSYMYGCSVLIDYPLHNACNNELLRLQDRNFMKLDSRERLLESSQNIGKEIKRKLIWVKGGEET